MHTEHGGEVSVNGVPAALHSPLAARQLGIQTVHQRIGEGIVPGLSVAENLVFEELAQTRGNPFLGGRRLLARAREIQSASTSAGATPCSGGTSPNSASPTASC